MSLRTRLLLAFAAIVLIPMALLAFGLRQEMNRRLSEEYQLRVDRVVEVIREDLARESAGIAERLESLETRAAERQPVSERGGGGPRIRAGISARLRGHGDAAHRALDAPDSGQRRPDSQLRSFPERAWPHRAWPGGGPRAARAAWLLWRLAAPSVNSSRWLVPGRSSSAGARSRSSAVSPSTRHFSRVSPAIEPSSSRCITRVEIYRPSRRSRIPRRTPLSANSSCR